MKNILLDKDWLIQQYSIERRSLQSIADELGTHRVTLTREMNMLKIPIRNRGEHFKGVHKDETQKEKMSLSRKKFWEGKDSAYRHAKTHYQSRVINQKGQFT